MPKNKKSRKNLKNNYIMDSKREVEEDKKINYLEELPPEIVQVIATFLSLQEMARLSLTNQKMCKTIRSTYCHNLGIWSFNHKGERILRPATFKDVSDNENYQVAEREKADILFDRKKKSLERKLKLLPNSDTVGHLTCTIVSSLLIAATGIASTVMLALNYGGEEDILKTLGIVFGGSIITGTATIGTISVYNSLGDRAEGITRELTKHQRNGRQKLHSGIKSNIVAMKR